MELKNQRVESAFLSIGISQANLLAKLHTILSEGGFQRQTKPICRFKCNKNF